ncbi:MAG: glycosyltransferase family 2 protein [Bradymonadaceae bacterium]
MNLYIDLFIFFYFIAMVLATALLVTLAIREIRHRRAIGLVELDEDILSESSTPPIAIVAPAYNEEIHVVESVEGFLRLDYPEVEIIVVNDGSTDSTLERLIEAFDLEPAERFTTPQLPAGRARQFYRSRTNPRLWVVDKENGGKADSLNTGINATRCPLVCCVDADTMLCRDALLRMVDPFLYDPEGVVCVGGTVRIINGCEVEKSDVKSIGMPRSWLARFQIVEYLGAFLFGRMGFNQLGGNMIVSGAAGLFLRSAIVEAGGYARNMIGEDAELVVRLHRQEFDSGRKRAIVHLAEPVCYTEVPEDLGTLARQRDRWHRGLADTLWRNRKMMFNKKYGRIGTVVMPWFFFFELIAPVIETLGYLWFIRAIFVGIISWPVALLFFAVAFLWGLFVAIQSLYVDHHSFNIYKDGASRRKLFLVAILLNLGYRQFTVFCRVVGFVRYFLGQKSWGHMRRRGFRRLEGAPA